MSTSDNATMTDNSIRIDSEISSNNRTFNDQLIISSNVICRGISQAFSAIVVCLIGAIVGGLGLIGGILIGVKFGMIITLATKVPLIGICVEFVTYIACTLIGVIAGGYIGIYQGKKLNII